MIRKLSYLFTFFIVFACSEDFTESPAVGALSTDILGNEAGIDLLLTGAYSSLNAVVNHGYGNGWGRAADNWTMDVMSDDAHKGSTDDDQADLKEMELYNWSPANGYWLARWGVLFAGTNRANAVIALAQASEDDLSSYEAQARFLRGHFNYNIQVMYGNVPYISAENFSNNEFNQPNSGAIWDQIVADFDYAIQNLPQSQSSAPGRPTSWAAKAYKGKALAQQGQYSQALPILVDVIENGPYDLLPNFGDNFKAKGENGSESIFAIQFTKDGGQSFNANIVGALNYPQGGPFGSCCGFYQPTQDLVNAYKTENGLPLLDTFNNTDVTNDYGIESSASFTPYAGELDPRLDFTVGRRGIDYNGYGIHIGKDWIRAGFNDISGPYSPKKNIYQKEESSQVQATGGWGEQLSGLNHHIMRLGGIVALAAEAAAEANDIPTALKYVNRLRARAKTSERILDTNGNPAANYNIETYASFANQAEAIKAARFERRLEIAMEGQRLFDLRRRGTSEAILNEYVRNEARTISNFGQKASSYQSKHDMFPIPQQAIDQSQGALSQNPGY
ncbi:MAG: SusD-like protein [Flavobacteriaceae bacterium]|nr:MAG: SusD-like protein [Flavobacteriaceae bacterium]